VCVCMCVSLCGSVYLISTETFFYPNLCRGSRQHHCKPCVHRARQKQRQVLHCANHKTQSNARVLCLQPLGTHRYWRTSAGIIIISATCHRHE
jgi:hypothetical protein